LDVSLFNRNTFFSLGGLLLSKEMSCGEKNLKGSFPLGKESLRHILDNLPDGLVIMDKGGCIIYCNPSAERISGLSASEATGIHCKDLFRSAVCQTSTLRRKECQGGGHFYDREFHLTRRDGSQLSVISSIFPFKDSEGNVVGGVQVFKDISDRKRLEDDLRLSESKYRRIFEGSKDMIFVTSRSGAIKDINQAGVDLLGYRSKEEFLALGSMEEVHENPMHWQVFQKQVDRHGFVKDFEAGLKRKDGTRMHCLLSGNAIWGEGGEVVGYEGIAKDITARMDAVRDLQKRHRELSLLNSIAVAINATQELEDVLTIALKNFLSISNLAAGGIFLIDHEMGRFHLKVQKGLCAMVCRDACNIRLLDDSLMGALLKKDLSLNPEPNFPPFQAVVQCNGATEPVSLRCFLITAKEKACGFLALRIPSRRSLSDQDFHLLGSLGNFLGGAIENNRLLQTIRKHHEELKGLTARLFQSQEVERRRIARELHDEAGQALTGIHFTLENIEKELPAGMEYVQELISEAKKQTHGTYQEMRRMSYRLHPALLTDLGLEPALDSYLRSIGRRTSLHIDFKMVGFEGRLAPEIETALYRLTQEVVTNTLKHARASCFRLSIVKGYPHIIFSAEDDGVGFDPRDMGTGNDSLGLLSMRERAAMMGGRFTLRSRRGGGTRVRIEIPLQEQAGEA
jgi:PAS domain S-box-containing protein